MAAVTVRCAQRRLRAPSVNRSATFPMCYGSAFKSHCHAKVLRRLGIRHRRTRPYTPRTNGKAGRFVQTSLREWAYARACATSNQRLSELAIFLFRDNWQRSHMSLNAKPPISRLGLAQDNL